MADLRPYSIATVYEQRGTAAPTKSAIKAFTRALHDWRGCIVFTVQADGVHEAKRIARERRLAVELVKRAGAEVRT